MGLSSHFLKNYSLKLTLQKSDLHYRKSTYFKRARQCFSVKFAELHTSHQCSLSLPNEIPYACTLSPCFPTMTPGSHWSLPAGLSCISHKSRQVSSDLPPHFTHAEAHCLCFLPLYFFHLPWDFLRCTHSIVHILRSFCCLTNSVPL